MKLWHHKKAKFTKKTYMTAVQIPPPGFPHVAELCVSVNSYANHLAERSHLYGLPGAPVSHGKSECECRSRGVEVADTSAPAGLDPDLFVVICFSFCLPKFLLNPKENSENL